MPGVACARGRRPFAVGMLGPPRKDPRRSWQDLQGPTVATHHPSSVSRHPCEAKRFAFEVRRRGRKRWRRSSTDERLPLQVEELPSVDTPHIAEPCRVAMTVWRLATACPRLTQDRLAPDLEGAAHGLAGLPPGIDRLATIVDRLTQGVARHAPSHGRFAAIRGWPMAFPSGEGRTRHTDRGWRRAPHAGTRKVVRSASRGSTLTRHRRRPPSYANP